MPGLFISYRRSDAGPWAGRLFDRLSKRFGKSQVFMDIEGGIPRGAKFAQVLETALGNCDVLLAVIGPQWLSCVRSDGRRRLEAPDDWVRTEIAATLRRNIPVMAVLVGKASLPQESDLPEELLPLLKRIAAEITDTRWDYDVGELVKDLLKLAPLHVADDVATANTGIRLLRDLITTVPQVADAVSRSKEVIENTQRQLGKLELFKTIHDCLHSIEFECLRPMQVAGATRSMRAYKICFAEQARRIVQAVQGGELNPALRDDLTDQLELTGAAFQAILDAPGEATFAQVISELNRLISRLPSQLNVSISDAARDLKLDHLVGLMATVRTMLATAGSSRNAEIEPFVQAIDALQRLRDELKWRVSEHDQLQSLDSKLRTVCVGELPPGSIDGEWRRIRLVRSRLVPPFSPELEEANQDLAMIESNVVAALERKDERTALDLVGEYFRSVSTVFRSVDAALKEFCLRLGAVNHPLQTILGMV